MSGFRNVVWGAFLGGIIGLGIPVVVAVLYLALGRDPQGAGAISFFPIVLIPLGLFLGGMVGSVWSPERTVGQNVLTGLWKAFKPRWI
jgi:hypothetical protein